MELDALHLENVKYSLFGKRRFLPMFLATFLGTFNDNLVRAGIIVMIAYAATHGILLPGPPEILVTICSALLVLPMVLFSSVAGELADKCEKSRLVMWTKTAEVLIMAGVYYGFATQNILLLMGLLFISGTHSTFYVPIKFSILPQHLKPGELLAGNGFMAGGSYIAILFGMIAGGLLVEKDHHVIGMAALLIALAGFFSSLCIPHAGAAHPETKVSFHLWRGSKQIIAYIARDRVLLHTVFAISWFLLIGSIFIAQFANYAGGQIHADNEVYILFLTVFSIGVAAGSLICDTLLKGEISARLTPLAALGMSIFIALMVWATPVPQHEGLMTLWEFLAVPKHWLVLGAMFMISACGGIYMVPLYAVLQQHSNIKYRSRVIAASNLSDSLGMTLAALVSALLLYFGASVTDLFSVFAIINLGVAWHARKLA